MKKAIYISGAIIILSLTVWFIYDKLPVKITRRADVRFGNELVLRIKNYKNEHSGLPLNDDWELLKQLGFRVEEMGTRPTYLRINPDEYELIYLEGFDAPYLLYNSNEKRWKTGFPKFPEKEVVEMEDDYPWSKRITAIAIQAILTSIDNINSDDPRRDENFPTDLYNMPFTRKEKTEFVIFGYSISSDLPNIYEIEFHPKDEYRSGPRYTVEVDIEKGKAIRVYMKPDA